MSNTSDRFGLPLRSALVELGLGEIVWQPNADVYRTLDGWLVKFDLAGVGPDDIKLSVQGPLIRIEGSRRDWLLEEGGRYHATEIAYSKFERSIELPCSIKQAHLEFREGMLIVRIRAEE